MGNIFGFYHICLINHWEKVIKEQIDLLINSGLYEKTQLIFVGCVGSQSDKAKLKKILFGKFNIIFHDVNIALAEIPTIQYMQHLSYKEDFILWYIHTKGVFSEMKYPTMAPWRKMLGHFMIKRHEDCVKIVSSSICDACGTEIRYRTDRNIRYFAGNFWWSKSSYVKKLPNITKLWIENNKSRYAAEDFIGNRANAKLYSFYQSDTKYYRNNINESEYVNSNCLVKVHAKLKYKIKLL